MKQFNQTISVQVEVDTIANQLRSMFKEDSANADLVVEQIIGRALEKDTRLIGRLMSAMSGFRKEIPLSIGEVYTVKELYNYGYVVKEDGSKVRERYKVEQVIVMEIDELKDNPVRVEFLRYETSTATEMTPYQEWICSSQFSL